MADNELMRGKFQILDTFLTFGQICGAQPEIMAEYTLGSSLYLFL